MWKHIAVQKSNGKISKNKTVLFVCYNFMSLVSLKEACLEFGEQIIFRDANFIIEKKERVCLIGRNGSGKSTLFRIVSGDQDIDQGEITRHPDIHISTLQQSLPEELTKTVYEVILEGLGVHQDLIEQYHALTNIKVTDKRLGEIERLQNRIESHGGWNIDTQVNRIATDLQLPIDSKLEALSGGWQRRVALAKALVSQPDLLLLDEPTNHLDLNTISWLEHQIRKFDGAVLFITHDRAFLKALATRIVDIDRGTIRSWPGSYDRYLRLRAEALETENRENKLFDKRLAQEEVWIRQGIKARRTRNEGRVRNLHTMREIVQERIPQEATAKILVQKSFDSSRKVIHASNVSYAYNDGPIINNLKLKIMRGERIGLIGNNGVGKSTLVKLFLGIIKPSTGTIKRGENLEIGYFDQVREKLNPVKSVAEIVGDGRDYIEINGKQRHVVGYLKGFLFSAKRAMTPVGFLSGGECNRVILAKIFSRPHNLLVLDEPTNDLDVETLEVLESQLRDYKGTLIVVSHDRTFLDNVVTSTLVFEENCRLKQYPGGYTDWVSKGQTLESKDNLLAASNKDRKDKNNRRKSRLVKLGFKEEYELNELPEKIEKLENRIKQLETEVLKPDFYDQTWESTRPIVEELEEKKKSLEELTQRWEELEQKKAALGNQSS